VQLGPKVRVAPFLRAISAMYGSPVAPAQSLCGALFSVCRVAGQ
jgi:hypothetical protein